MEIFGVVDIFADQLNSTGGPANIIDADKPIEKLHVL